MTYFLTFLNKFAIKTNSFPLNSISNNTHSIDIVLKNFAQSSLRWKQLERRMSVGLTIDGQFLIIIDWQKLKSHAQPRGPTEILFVLVSLLLVSDQNKGHIRLRLYFTGQFRMRQLSKIPMSRN